MKYKIISKNTFLVLFTLINIQLYSQVKEYYYTTVEKIYKLEKDMTYDRVNDILGILPNDIYVDYNNGKKIVTYLYKNRYHEVLSDQTDSEMALNGGSSKYKSDLKEDQTLYCFFNQNNQKLESYVTDLGLDKAKGVLKDEQNLKAYIENPTKIRKNKNNKKVKLKGKSLNIKANGNSLKVDDSGVTIGIGN